MKIRCSSIRRATYLLASLLALGQATHAQETRGVRTIQGRVGGGAGAGFHFVQRIDGSGPARGVMIVINGQDIGTSFLKFCDTNQDGAASFDEVITTAWNWFRQSDTDTNGALSEVELAATLKSLFPMPEPPPGAPPLSEDLALHNLLAKKLVASVDANKDTWITLKEMLAFVGQNVSTWDADGGGSLDASEFAGAFAQFMPAPSLNSGFGVGVGPSLDMRFER